MKNLICLFLITYSLSSFIQVHKPAFLLAHEFKQEISNVWYNEVYDLGSYSFPKDAPKVTISDLALNTIMFHDENLSIKLGDQFVLSDTIPGTGTVTFNFKYTIGENSNSGEFILKSDNVGIYKSFLLENDILKTRGTVEIKFKVDNVKIIGDDKDIVDLVNPSYQ